jgi:hypothetical protein
LTWLHNSTADPTAREAHSGTQLARVKQLTLVGAAHGVEELQALLFQVNHTQHPVDALMDGHDDFVTFEDAGVFA